MRINEYNLYVIKVNSMMKTENYNFLMIIFYNKLIIIILILLILNLFKFQKLKRIIIFNKFTFKNI